MPFMRPSDLGCLALSGSQLRRSELRRLALRCPQCVLLPLLKCKRRGQLRRSLVLDALLLLGALLLLMLQFECGWRLASFFLFLLRCLLRVGRILQLGPPFGLLLRCLSARSLIHALRVLCGRCLALCERLLALSALRSLSKRSFLSDEY